MRMRRKKNGEQRLENCGYLVVKNPNGMKGQWRQQFRNDNPIHLEIGCGKGRFITEMALKNPDINYIAIEKNKDILVLAAEKAFDAAATNIRFLEGDAACLTEVFDKGECEMLYLNFSDPWRKGKHAKRRLTHKNYLDVYKQLLDIGSEIHFKTDNRDFFEFSLNSLCDNDFKLRNITFDLHSSDFERNIMTEYEELFSEKGHPIYRLEAIIK